MALGTYELTAIGILVTAVVFLGIGYALQTTRRKHLFRIVGWVLFGTFWLTYIPYYQSIEDMVNVFFCAAAFPVFLYLAYHEYKSHVWDEDPTYMKFAAGAAFVAATVYYGISWLSSIASGIIYVVALQSASLGRIMGMNVAVDTQARIWSSYSVFGAESGGVRVYFGDPAFMEFVTIIFACTAIQSIMIFAATALATERVNPNKITDEFFIKKLRAATPLRQRKLRALVITVPLIYVLNLFRNAGVMYGVFVLDVSFELMHNYVAKAGSLIVMVILAVYIFNLLPELHNHIVNLASLPKRERDVNVG